MKRSKFSEEKVLYALSQSEASTPSCRHLSATGHGRGDVFCVEEKYAHLGVSELQRLRQLEEENSHLKRLVADLSLDKHMLAEALRKKVEARL